MSKRSRRHSNTKGTRQIRRGKTRDQVKRIAKRLQVAYDQPVEGAVMKHEKPPTCPQCGACVRHAGSLCATCYAVDYNRTNF